MALLRLTKAQLDKALGYKDVYFRAQELTGIPWEFVAALHYRERNFNAGLSISNPFQFDPRPDSTTRRHLYSKFSSLTSDQTSKMVGLGLDNFQAAAIYAACFTKHKREQFNVSTDYTSDETIKELFWSYNGRVKHSPENSSYVMNGYDHAHEDMIMSAGTIDGKPITPKIDHRPGAFVVYCQIKGRI